MAEDRNQNVKNQLLKKRDEASRRKVPLAPGEMVDDALSRGSESATRWLKKNFGVVQWFILAAIAGGVGYGYYDYRTNKKAETASGDLVKGVQSERGRVRGVATPPKPEDDGPEDPTPVFKTADERRDTALASYRKVSASSPGSGAGILGRLGEAGVLLDKKDWDGAIAAYRDVQGSALAKVDVSVRGAALEGMGFAFEGKGAADEALRAYQDLEKTDARGQKELGMFHQARLLFAKGELDKAKELLKGAREKLKATNGPSPSPGFGNEARPFIFLELQIEDLLKRIDPTALLAAAPLPAPGGAGKPANQDDLQRIQEQLKRKIQESQEKAGTGQGSTPRPPAGSP